MVQESYDTWIFSDVELNICARMLGYPDWYRVHVGEDQEPLEKRMLDGFLSLLEKNLLSAEGNAFVPTEKMRTLMSPLMDPDEIIREDGTERNSLFFRKKGKSLMRLEKMDTEEHSFRLYFVPETEMTDMISQEDEVKEDGIN